MFEARVGRLEDDMKSVKASLERIETKLTDVQVKLGETGGRIGAVDGRLAGIEGRLGSIPTTWQIIGILAALLFGVASIVFAASRFFKP